MSEANRNTRYKVIQGRVVSDKMEKTRVILIETTRKHPLFKKIVRKSRRVKIHDEKGISKIGDLISAIETRPYSRDKRHRIFKVLEQAK